MSIDTAQWMMVANTRRAVAQTKTATSNSARTRSRSADLQTLVRKTVDGPPDVGFIRGLPMHVACPPMFKPLRRGGDPPNPRAPAPTQPPPQKTPPTPPIWRCMSTIHRVNRKPASASARDLSCTLFADDPEGHDGGNWVIEEQFTAPKRSSCLARACGTYPSNLAAQVQPPSPWRTRRHRSFWVQSMVSGDGTSARSCFDLINPSKELSASAGHERPTSRAPGGGGEETGIYSQNLIRNGQRP